MAKRATTVVGLEIEPAAVHAAAVTVNGKVAIREAAVVPLEAGVVRDGEVNDVDGLAEALRTLYRDHKGLDKKVRIGVANQKIVVRVLELPPIDDRKELEAETRDLQRRSAALAAKIRAAQGLGPAASTGSAGQPSSAGLAWPVAGPITSGFGP
ncbi:MAG: pilus assembly protein PilM, partial [Solirubrobacterales bacterium]|nr:pilus assembly protein PilM [Solirubrobacterales bacterium]